MHQVGEDLDDGIADRVLRADHVVVEAAHQLARLGVGEEAQGHALEVRVEGDAQIVDHAFADAGVEPALEDADQPAHRRDANQGQCKEIEAGKIAVGEGAVNQVAQDQRPEQPQPGARQDGEEHPGDQPPVRPGVAHHPPEQRPGHVGLCARACEAAVPAQGHPAPVLYP